MFFKKKKKPDPKPLVAPETIYFCRFTYEAWQKEFPKLTQKDYDEINSPDNLLYFITTKLNSMAKICDISKNKYVKVVPIDDEYFDWLDKNSLKSSPEARNKYAATLSDDDLYRLLDKNDWLTEYEVNCLPIYLLNTEFNKTKKMDFKLSDSIKNDLLKYLESIYGEQKVFVPGYILNQDLLFSDIPSFSHIGKIYFTENQTLRCLKYEEQDFTMYKDTILIYPFCIPFVVKRQYKSAVFDISELLKDIAFVPIYSLSKETFSAFDLSVPSFEETDVCKKIKEYLGPDSYTVSSIVRGMDLQIINIAFQEQLCRSKFGLGK